MNSTLAGRTSDPAVVALWRVAQGIAVAATVALIAALFMERDAALTALWDVAIPLLPAVFLVQPAIWRNICPLGTTNMLLNRWGCRRVLDDQLIPRAGSIGIVLLTVMVPARRFLFNADGDALAVTIVLVAIVALALGAVYDRKAGFCSSICPVLPVERLYGQDPFIDVANSRCGPCTMCTVRGCVDIAGTKSIAQTLGRTRRSHGWLYTSYGAFAAGFPGFVMGYNQTVDGPLGTAGRVYLTVAAWTIASWILANFIVRGLDLTAAAAIRMFAALAIALYYWYAAAVVTSHLGLPPASPIAIRTVAFGLITWWLWRAAGRIPLRMTHAARR